MSVVWVLATLVSLICLQEYLESQESTPDMVDSDVAGKERHPSSIVTAGAMGADTVMGTDTAGSMCQRQMKVMDYFPFDSTILDLPHNGAKESGKHHPRILCELQENVVH